MFGIPPVATVNEVVPTVTDALVDAVAEAVPAAQFDEQYRLWLAALILIDSFGASGSPVFGVHADRPTNRVCDGDSFFRMHTGFTPVPVGVVNTTVGSGVEL